MWLDLLLLMKTILGGPDTPGKNQVTIFVEYGNFFLPNNGYSSYLRLDYSLPKQTTRSTP